MSNTANFIETEIGFIPEDWDVKQLNQLVTKLGDGLHGTPEYDDTGDYYFINGNNLVNGKIVINENTRKCSKSEFEKYKKELTNRTIFVSINGTLGNIALYEGEQIILGKSACYFNVKDEFSKLYVQYALKNKTFQNHIQLTATGTTIKNVSLKQMREYTFGIPKNLSEQETIAKILSDLDSKIELLQKQNNTLERIGQSIFKQWFVDFEFPNEEGKPYKSSGGEMIESELGEIPEGWSVGFLDDGVSTKLIKTGINDFEGEKIYLDTASVQNSDIVDATTKITLQEKPSRANMQPIPKSIWFAKMKDSKKVLLIDEFDDMILNEMILSTGFSGLQPLNGLLYYIWTIIHSDKFEIEKNSFCLGTTMQAINNENIRKIKYLIPDNRVITLFNTTVSKNYVKISLNKLEIVSLQKTRDLLLPKLMSGQIRVPLEVEE
ncbi:MAG: restriction endonuclease subunit S [Nanoarchaeota archaeon]|nr:restriction endonuclease subunit S [Nanoarchaeota archaeon]